LLEYGVAKFDNGGGNVAATEVLSSTSDNVSSFKYFGMVDIVDGQIKDC
jgi:hypothetical protein